MKNMRLAGKVNIQIASKACIAGPVKRRKEGGSSKPKIEWNSMTFKQLAEGLGKTFEF